MNKTILYVILVIIALLISFRYSFKYIMKWKNEKQFTFNSELPNSKIFIDNNLEIDYYELNSIKSLVELTIKQVDSLLPNDLTKVKVYLSRGNGSATTIPEFNKITLYNSEDCYAPFCHEYIHNVLGVHRELWFSEGLATFLGQEIRSKNEMLKKYCDGDERYLIEARALKKGPLKRNQYLDEKYTYNSIKDLMLSTRVFIELTEENKLDFYFFSTSFCKYLFEIIGEKEMIKIILKIKDSHNSIAQEFQERNIKLDELLNSWLIEYRK